jgi:hypothetical protein
VDVRFIKSQTSFKSGRLSPKLYNRIDTKQYDAGASIMKGFRVIPEGGAEAIKGKRWINDNAYNPFIGFDDTKQISFAIGKTQLTAVLVTNSFNQVDLYLYTYPYVHGTEQVINIVSAGPTEYPTDLFDFIVSDNFLILTHFNGNLQTQYLEFDEATGNYLGTKLLGTVNPLTVAYDDFKEDPITLSNFNLGTKTVDLTSTDPDVVAYLQSKTTFYAEGFGSRKNPGDNRTYNFIASNFYRKSTNITNGVRVIYQYQYTEDAIVEEALTFANITTIDTWAANLFGPGNWPKSVTSYEGRVVFGGCPSKPLSIVGSRVSSVEDFNRIRLADTGSSVYTTGGKGGESLPTDPYLFTISADEDSEITAIRSASELFIGTDRREYIATGGDTILSSLSVQVKPYTSQGVYPISAITMGNLVCYVDQTRKKLFQFKFNDANGTFLSDDLSLLFGDLMEDDRIQQLAWAPHVKVLYVLTEKEILYGITYDPSSETQAFFETLETGVTSISYVAAREEQVGESHHRGDHILMFVRGKGLMSYEQVFYEKGITNSYIQTDIASVNEYLFLEDVYEIKRASANNYSINGENYVTGSDSFPIPTGAPVFAVPFRAVNLDTGESVTIENLTPDGGNPWFLADDPVINGASKILVGNIPTKEKILATMPIEAGQQFGPAQLGIKNIDELGIRFYKSYSYSISSNGEDWQLVRVADKLGNASTGREETKFQASHKYDFVVYIKQDKAEPLVITGINMRGVSNDG